MSKRLELVFLKDSTLDKSTGRLPKTKIINKGETKIRL